MILFTCENDLIYRKIKNQHKKTVTEYAYYVLGDTTIYWIPKNKLISKIKNNEVYNATLSIDQEIVHKPLLAPLSIEQITPQNQEEVRKQLLLKYAYQCEVSWDYPVSEALITIVNKSLAETSNNLIIVKGAEVINAITLLSYPTFTLVYFALDLDTNTMIYLHDQITMLIPNAIFEAGRYNYDETQQLFDAGYKKLDYRSNLNKPNSNRLTYAYGNRLYTRYDTSLLVKAVEERFFPPYTPNFNISILIKDTIGKDPITKSLTAAMSDKIFVPYWREDNSASMIGFHYFKSDDIWNLPSPKVKLLVAHIGNIMIGVIKYGVWGKERYQSVSFIDVHLAYRNKGIAKRMIQELNKHLDTTMPLVLTDESEMGAKCHMADNFIRYITSTKVYRNNREYIEEALDNKSTRR